MFIGRELELSVLNRIYGSGKFEFALIYGRRRIGKTSIINEFVSDKSTIYFMATENSKKKNLENLSKTIAMCMHCDIIPFYDFVSAFDYIFQLSCNERIILVIDNYQHLAKVYKNLNEDLAMLIDKYKEISQLFLIISGSPVDFMEDSFLSPQSALYGKRTARFKIMPFEFKEFCQWFSNFSDEDKAILYGITAGIPYYMLQINDEISLRENIENVFFNPLSPMYDEPTNMLNKDLRELSFYNTILSTIALGYERMSEISEQTGEDTSVCSVYIKNLISLGVIRRMLPYGEANSRKAIYKLNDSMSKFWYSFVPDNRWLAECNFFDVAYENIEPYIDDYMKDVFIEICRQYLWNCVLIGKCKVNFSETGSWWGVSSSKEIINIDIVGEENNNKALIADCVWKEELLDIEDIENLLNKGKYIRYGEKHYYLFSKSGFTYECKRRAQMIKNVNLVSYEDLMNSLLC